MKKIILFTSFLSVFLIFTLEIFSQEAKPLIKDKPGQIYLQNGDVIDYKSIEQNGDGFTYKLEGNAEPLTIKSKNVYEIFQEQGSYAFEYGAAGALCALLGGILGTMDWDQYDELKDSKGSFIIGTTIGGAVIGGVAGALIKKNQLVFTSGENQISLKPIINTNHNIPYSNFRPVEVGFKVVF